MRGSEGSCQDEQWRDDQRTSRTVASRASLSINLKGTFSEEGTVSGNIDLSTNIFWVNWMPRRRRSGTPSPVIADVGTTETTCDKQK